MVIDPANITQTTLQSKSEQEATPDVTKESNVNNQGIPEAGKTSEIGPAVAVNISAATLETSRAINAPEQIAEQNSSNDIVKAQEKNQLKSDLSSQATPQSIIQSTIDTNV